MFFGSIWKLFLGLLLGIYKEIRVVKVVYLVSETFLHITFVHLYINMTSIPAYVRTILSNLSLHIFKLARQSHPLMKV